MARSDIFLQQLSYYIFSNILPRSETQDDDDEDNIASDFFGCFIEQNTTANFCLSIIPVA